MVDKSSQLSTLASNIKEGIEARLKELHTSLPGIVESFDPETQTASIQPAIKRIFKTNDGDKEILTPENLPILINVPVQFPRGGGFSITFPVKKGDECLLVFCERSIDSWYTSGKISEPLSRRFHSLSDATAFVGISSSTNSIPNYSADDLQIKKDDGSVEITLFNDNSIKLKGTTVTIDANLVVNGTVDSTGDINSDGTIEAATDVKGGGKSLLNHTHIGSPTAATGPVSPTGAPI